VRVNVDGTEEINAPYVNPVAAGNSTYPLYVLGNGGSALDGEAHELLYVDRVLSDTECALLEAYWS
jgi:hypothetical protein